MSAAAYGDGLLNEVQEESLDELLRSLREIKTNHRPSTGIPAIDNILNVFLHPPPPQRQRSQYHPHPSDQDPPLPPPPPPPANPKQPPAVIEITGATPCSGKTQLLALIIATAILPRQYHGVPLGGKDQAVVLLDPSHTFSIPRLRDIMHNLLLTALKPSSSSSSSTPPQPPSALNSLITSSLLHLHIFHPVSTPSLLSTLTSLPSYLLPPPGSNPTPPHFSLPRPLSVIALSNLSAFLWQDRLDADDDAAAATALGPFSSGGSLLHDLYRTLTHHLTHLQHLLSCLVIATTSTPYAAPTNQPQSLRPHLPHPWPGFAICKIIVQRHTVPKFEPGTSVQEAEGQRGRGWDVVREGRFVGGVNWWGSEEGGWRDEWREGVRRLRGGGKFGFVVGERGVHVVGGEGDV